MAWEKLYPLLMKGLEETLYMTFWSSLIAYLIGLPLGVLLVVTRKGGILPCPTFNAVLGVIINFLRSIPFIIMLAVLFPSDPCHRGQGHWYTIHCVSPNYQRIPLHRPNGGKLSG